MPIFVGMKVSGIYIIRNLTNNKVYIGSSNNIVKRFKTHKDELIDSIHKNPHLQQSVDKYGIDNFSFELLEECIIEDLLIRECYYVQIHESLDGSKGYNLVLPKRIDDSVSNLEYRTRLSEIKKGIRPANYEYCKSMLMRPILEYENGQFVREYESCKAAGVFLEISYKLINNVLRGTVKRIKRYPSKTWVYKEGSVRKIKRVKQGWKKGKGKPVIIYNVNREIIARYNTINEASEKLDICEVTITKYCKNRKLMKKTNNYIEWDTTNL